MAKALPAPAAVPRWAARTNDAWPLARYGESESLRAWQQAIAAAGLHNGGRLTVVDDDKLLTALPDRRIQATHGSFDNDIATMREILLHIIGSEPQRVVDDLRGF